MADTATSHFSSMQVNLHTHSWYCGHGTGQLSEYVSSARSAGIPVLGFSEHCPLPDGRWKNSRMAYTQMDTYLQECRTLGALNNDMHILCGFECDYDARYIQWYAEHLVDTKKVDYLCFGVHYLVGPDGKETYIKNLPSQKQWLDLYTDTYVAGLKSGLFLFGVHPDLFGMFYKEWDKDAEDSARRILSCAAEFDIPLEINGYGFRKPQIDTQSGRRLQYPLEHFWKLASEYPVKVILNSDAHRPQDLDLQNTGAFEFTSNLGIRPYGWNVGRNADTTVLSLSQPLLSPT